MSGMLIGLLVAVAVIVVVVLAVIGIFNALQRARIAAEGSFSNIDVELRRRHDLIPNLVETVKGYATHERQTLEAVMQARAAAMSAKGINERIEAEGALTRGLGRLMAVAEAYPTLKADGGFMRLQGDLSDTENRIASRRTGFNGAAAGFNELLSVFPNNIVAGIFGFRAMSFLKEDDEAVRSAPQVKF
ncbi:MAG: LemA family protein [Planctomycetaceae bacterium]|jgi:LemA protein|nr:LemA family protein [Planctomycetaceae bacterium]